MFVLAIVWMILKNNIPIAIYVVRKTDLHLTNRFVILDTRKIKICLNEGFPLTHILNNLPENHNPLDNKVSSVPPDCMRRI